MLEATSLSPTPEHLPSSRALIQALHVLRHPHCGIEQLPSTTTWVKFQIDRDCRLRVARNAGLRFSAG